MDDALGFFVSVREPGRRLGEYDALHPGYADLDGALDFLGAHGFLDEDAVVEAKMWLEDEGGEGALPRAVHAAATVICDFKAWARPEGGVDEQAD